MGNRASSIDSRLSRRKVALLAVAGLALALLLALVVGPAVAARWPAVALATAVAL